MGTFFFFKNFRNSTLNITQHHHHITTNNNMHACMHACGGARQLVQPAAHHCHCECRSVRSVVSRGSCGDQGPCGVACGLCSLADPCSPLSCMPVPTCLLFQYQLRFPFQSESQLRCLCCHLRPALHACAHLLAIAVPCLAGQGAIKALCAACPAPQPATAAGHHAQAGAGGCCGTARRQQPGGGTSSQRGMGGGGAHISNGGKPHRGAAPAAQPQPYKHVLRQQGDSDGMLTTTWT